MTKSDKFKILGKYIKDLSSETPNVETYLFVRDYISSYQLGIDITSKALKDKLIEINTKLKFEDKKNNKKRYKRKKRIRKNYTMRCANSNLSRS